MRASDPASQGSVPRRIAIIGAGLIGGSIARAVREADVVQPELVAWSPSGRGPRAGVAAGAFDGAAARIEEALAGTDLVILAAPPLETLALVDRLGGDLRGALAPEATVTDVTSTKAAVVGRAAGHRLPFVGGHPMAGREASGFEASDATLFHGRPWVVTPGPDARPRDVARVEWLALACRARPVRMEAAVHDRATAGISHLPLVLAVALVEAVVGTGEADRADWPEAATLAASGWRDMTRLARGDVAMGAGIAATNAAALASRLRDLRDVIDGWIAELERDGGPDPERLAERMRAARDRLERR